MFDKDGLSKVVTYKESSPGSCEFRDIWSDFHGRKVSVQYAILVNEDKSMGDRYVIFVRNDGLYHT